MLAGEEWKEHGPSVISTTMDIYSHVLPAMKGDAADLMDSILTAQK
ncbi:MAG TPA: hypothetical protein VNQ79_03550 [Blastocatellia bacterium]|nr:hypothetical protein [Blastocatellia bacterium]